MKLTIITKTQRKTCVQLLVRDRANGSDHTDYRISVKPSGSINKGRDWDYLQTQGVTEGDITIALAEYELFLKKLESDAEASKASAVVEEAKNEVRKEISEADLIYKPVLDKCDTIASVAEHDSNMNIIENWKPIIGGVELKENSFIDKIKTKWIEVAPGDDSKIMLTFDDDESYYVLFELVVGQWRASLQIIDDIDLNLEKHINDAVDNVVFHDLLEGRDAVLKAFEAVMADKCSESLNRIALPKPEAPEPETGHGFVLTQAAKNAANSDNEIFFELGSSDAQMKLVENHEDISWNDFVESQISNIVEDHGITEEEAEDQVHNEFGFFELPDLIKLAAEGKRWPLDLGLVEVVKEAKPEALEVDTAQTMLAKLSKKFEPKSDIYWDGDTLRVTPVLARIRTEQYNGGWRISGIYCPYNTFRQKLHEMSFCMYDSQASIKNAVESIHLASQYEQKHPAPIAAAIAESCACNGSVCQQEKAPDSIEKAVREAMVKLSKRESPEDLSEIMVDWVMDPSNTLEQCHGNFEHSFDLKAEILAAGIATRDAMKQNASKPKLKLKAEWEYVETPKHTVPTLDLGAGIKLIVNFSTDPIADTGDYETTACVDMTTKNGNTDTISFVIANHVMRKLSDEHFFDTSFKDCEELAIEAVNNTIQELIENQFSEVIEIAEVTL